MTDTEQLQKELKKDLKNFMKDFASSSKSSSMRDQYSQLSDKEKEDIKNSMVESAFIESLIAKHHNPFLLEDINFKTQDKLYDYVLSLGYKKFNSKKAKNFILSRSFVFQVEGYYSGLKPLKFNKKDLLCRGILLLPIKTHKGMLYIDIREESNSENTGSYSVYTGHFFDRYKERLGLSGDRDKIIRRFIKKELQLGNGANSYEFNKNSVIYNTSEGLGLGKRLTDGIILKTFISNKEINEYQKKRKESLTEYIQSKTWDW